MDRRSPEPPEKKARIHFGSIEESEKARLAAGASLTANASNIFKGDIRNTIALSEESQASAKAHNEILKELERKKRARNLALPTEDAKVKKMLRELDHPICLFGELAHNRRDRLREVLSKLDDRQLEAVKREESPTPQEEMLKDEEFFTLGSKELKEARLWIAKYSLPRAKARIQAQKEEQERDPAILQNEKNDIYNRLKRFTNSCSQIGEDRPIAFCRLTNDSKQMVTGSWNGSLKLWNVPSSTLAFTWRGQEQRIGGIDFHPQSRISLGEDAANMVTGASDGKVYLWSFTSTDPVGELVGHTQRVARVAFHPSGRFIGTSSYDSSWRLWDAETRQEVLLQEGHFNEVYGIAFHPDGSLVGSSGLDSIGRVWDLRSGRSIYAMEGHVNQVLAIDFSPNGYHIATGSDDNTIRIWDLRKRKCVYTIPAHQNLVSHLKFEPTRGDYLVSASFDNTLRIWGSKDWKPVKTLAGHENKVMCADISMGGNFIASCAYDRTFKLWEDDSII